MQIDEAEFRRRFPRRYWETKAENLEAQNKELLTALKDMLFAYTNKDGEFPHGFETEAVEAAEKIIAEVEKD